jgi:predicted regulator of Ras-like GTPase activity (Roadblock/LC7/MglB family)
MSAVTQPLRFKMFSFFKNILRRRVETQTVEDPAPTGDTEVFEDSATELDSNPAAPVRRGNGNHQNGRGLDLPLRSILHGLPLELQPRVRQAEVGDATITVPLEKVLSQLARGCVKISFAELRQAAPQIFAPAPDRDRVMVTLPLADILARLNPALITRRRIQKHVEVPVEISSPFDSRGQGLAFAFGRKTEPEPAAPIENPAPVPVAGIRSTITAAPTPAPPTAMPTAAPRLSLARGAGETPPARFAPAPAATPAKPAAVPPLLVGLTALAEGWPDAVRQEIVQLNLVDARVGLPTEAVERALKQGRIAFTWKMLRSWIRPAPLPTVSAHDGSVLELPLKVVAPLFLARQNENAGSQQKVAIDESIPNLFFGFPQPESSPSAAPATAPSPAAVPSPATVPAAAPVPAATPAPAKLADTNYYVWDDSSDTVRLHESEVKRGNAAPGTSCLTRYATPNEIVSRAAALDGVAGALIALPDGLMVASHLAADLNGETLAAFLPQIFGKVSQSTKELRMGELNNLNFTVGNTPWKIFRVNAIFFAVFGRPGEPLPSGQLVALAEELDRKPK